MQANFFDPPQAAGRGAATRGMAWLGVAQAFRVLLSFASVVTISRLLLPDDFGLVALAGPLLAFVGMLQDGGLGQSLIQEKDMTHGRASAIFWASSVAACGGSIVLLAGAVPTAWFFDRPDMVGVMVAFSILPVLGALQSPHMSILNRRMAFGRLAAIDIVVALVNFLVCLAAAWAWRSYWALVLSSIVSSIVGVGCAWLACRWTPGRPHFDAGFKKALRFGSGLSIFNVFNFITRNADNLIIGKMLGAAQLGLYDRAYRLLLSPLQQVNAPIGRVMVPFLSATRGDPERYRNAYLESVTAIMIATQPAVLLATLCSDRFVHVLLGPSWGGVAPIFYWLGACSLHQVFTATLGWLFLSQGRGRDLATVGAVSCVISVAAFVLGLRWGAVGVAAAYTLSDYAIKAPVLWILSGRQGPVGVATLVSGVAPHAAAVVVAAVVVIASGFPWQPLSLLGFLGAGAATQAAYLATLVAFPGKRSLMERWMHFGFEKSRIVFARAVRKTRSL